MANEDLKKSLFKGATSAPAQSQPDQDKFAKPRAPKKVAVSCYLDPGLYDAMYETSKKNKISISQIIDIALREAMDYRE